MDGPVPRVEPPRRQRFARAPTSTVPFKSTSSTATLSTTVSRNHSRQPSNRSVATTSDPLDATHAAQLAIRFQIAEEVREHPSLDDPLLGDIIAKTPVDPDLQEEVTGISDYRFVPRSSGGVLGSGKFSSVFLATKAGKKYAVKWTPLYPHHPLIATRLLREPTILAQLPTHRNLISVSETIRTPGNFYLVERALIGYVTLDTLVTSSPDGKLPIPLARLVLDQLVSVCREALHKPIRIAHRDIKPENVLIHPTSHHLVLLDFGLATHFSEREARLTTCCGSPAYHAPELWLSQRSSPGSVRYWGPEIDIWCIGVSMLRCLIAQRYPLGIKHDTLDSISNRVTSALDKVPDAGLRAALAGMLEMDGQRRMDAFAAYELSTADLPVSDIVDDAREFKTTSFVPTEPKYTLPLPVTSVFSPTSSPLVLQTPLEGPDFADALSPLVTSSSSDSLRTTLEVPSLEFSNPTNQPSLRIVSYLKYALRCAGILYYAFEAPASAFASHGTESGSSSDLSDRAAASDELIAPLYLRCVIDLPAEAPTAAESRAHDALMSALRPPMQRASTSFGAARSSSTPPTKAKAATATPAKTRCLAFWLSIAPGPRRSGMRSAVSSRATSPARALDERARSRTRSNRPNTLRPPERIIVQLSDERAMARVQAALSIGSEDAPTTVNDRGRRGRGTQRSGLATVRNDSSTTPTIQTPGDEAQGEGFFDAAKRIVLARAQSAVGLDRSASRSRSPSPVRKPKSPVRIAPSAHFALF